MAKIRLVCLIIILIIQKEVQAAINDQNLCSSYLEMFNKGTKMDNEYKSFIEFFYQHGYFERFVKELEDLRADGSDGNKEPPQKSDVENAIQHVIPTILHEKLMQNTNSDVFKQFPYSDIPSQRQIFMKGWLNGQISDADLKTFAGVKWFHVIIDSSIFSNHTKDKTLALKFAETYPHLAGEIASSFHYSKNDNYVDDRSAVMRPIRNNLDEKYFGVTANLDKVDGYSYSDLGSPKIMTAIEKMEILEQYEKELQEELLKTVNEGTAITNCVKILHGFKEKKYSKVINRISQCYPQQPIWKLAIAKRRTEPFIHGHLAAVVISFSGESLDLSIPVTVIYLPPLWFRGLVEARLMQIQDNGLKEEFQRHCEAISKNNEWIQEVLTEMSVNDLVSFHTTVTKIYYKYVHKCRPHN